MSFKLYFSYKMLTYRTYAVFNTISLKIYIFINVWLHTIQTRFKLYTQTSYDDNNFRCFCC